jgi:DHA3 family macrolide efflux protein-like MFS transporter
MNNNWKKQFGIIYAGQAFSLLGSSAVQFSIIWWLTVETNSALMLSLSTIAAFLPFLLFGSLAGVIIDRKNRKTIMICADGLVALTSVALGLAFLILNKPPIWFIFVILFFRGLGSAFHSPAIQAAIPTLVPIDMLTKANGWSSLVISLSSMLGPVLGAALMAALPIASIMLVDILGAIFAIVCLLFVNIPKVISEHLESNFSRDFKEGFAALKANKPLWRIFFPILLIDLLFMPLGSLYPLLVKAHYSGTAWHNSIVEFVFAGGMLISSLILGVWGGMKRRFLMISLATVTVGIATLIGGALPSEGFPAFVICCFFMGAMVSFMNVPLISYIQETIPPDMMGKVLSIQITATTLIMPLGLLLGGLVGEEIGLNKWFFWSGVIMIFVGMLSRFLTRKYDHLTMLPEKKTNVIDSAEGTRL